METLPVAQNTPEETAPLQKQPSGFIGSLQQNLGFNSAFMRQNYTRITSAMRIAGDLLTVESGHAFSTPTRSIAASISIVASTLGIIFKQKPQTQEELDQLNDMSRTQYVLERLKQSFEPHKHIRQTIAASMMVASSLFMAAAIKSKRIGEGITSIIVFVSGGFLSFTKDDNKAWRNYAVTSALTTPVSIGYAYEAGVLKHDPYVASSIAVHQASHAISFLETYGRKEKDAGTLER